MSVFSGLTRKTLFSSVSAERRKKEHDCYLKNGSAVLEELLALCDGNCRIPIRYFSAIEIHNAIKYSKCRINLSDVYITGSLDNHLVLVRFNRCRLNNIHRDIAVTAQMSHLKNVLRLVGCCLEFEQLVYEYVEENCYYLEDGNRLRIANEVASAIVFLHTEFTTPIIFKDLNPSNVIIDQNSGVGKILDFSLSISLPPGKLEVVKDITSRNGCLAPEYAISGIVTQKADVYSFGVVLLQLLTGEKMSTLNIEDPEYI
ncbi:non-functional pseudokinase ZED1-like [Solanum verrucosum]|uniref:non-functional pseudokinase ZED1-like n=1 Tax=Solanum verrucosum TaxID=315347 RepID=UPI0020D0E31E|nr:non-functional pseudokinase ZED1-like [Solanum verrucosum]